MHVLIRICVLIRSKIVVTCPAVCKPNIRTLYAIVRQCSFTLQSHWSIFIQFSNLSFLKLSTGFTFWLFGLIIVGYFFSEPSWCIKSFCTLSGHKSDHSECSRLLHSEWPQSLSFWVELRVGFKLICFALRDMVNVLKFWTLLVRQKSLDKQCRSRSESSLLSIHTVKPVLSGHSKRRPKLFFQTDYYLMQVKSIAECSNGSILQYFGPSLSYHLSLKSLFCLFFNGLLWQVLLYKHFVNSSSDKQHLIWEIKENIYHDLCQMNLIHSYFSKKIVNEIMICSKQMFWVLKMTVSMRQFFQAPTT